MAACINDDNIFASNYGNRLYPVCASNYGNRLYPVHFVNSDQAIRIDHKCREAIQNHSAARQNEHRITLPSRTLLPSCSLLLHPPPQQSRAPPHPPSRLDPPSLHLLGYLQQVETQLRVTAPQHQTREGQKELIAGATPERERRTRESKSTCLLHIPGASKQLGRGSHC